MAKSGAMPIFGHTQETITYRLVMRSLRTKYWCLFSILDLFGNFRWEMGVATTHAPSGNIRPPKPTKTFAH